MNLDQFDLNLLVALDALLTEKNVTHAGIRIHRSQSAMSGALARLRNFFHDELLVPVGHRMALTVLARSLVKPVRNILLDVQATITTKPRFDPATSKRHFSVALTDYVTVVFLVDALRDIKRQAPQINFELRPAGERAVEALENGTLDFLIIPDIFASEIHPKMALFEDTHTCIAWAGNSRIGAKLSLEEYLNLGHVIVRVTERQSLNFEELFFGRVKHKRRAEVVTPSFDVVPHLVVGTDRIATVTTRLATKYAKSFPLKLITSPIEIPPLIEVLQWHKYQDQDPGCVWLRAVLKHAAAKLPQVSAVSPDGAQSPLRTSRARRSAIS